MIALSTIQSGDRIRATVSPADYEKAPFEARDTSRPNTIHWVADPVVNGTALDGAYWALGWSLSTIFGSTIGAILEEMTLVAVEVWNGSEWVTA